MNILMSILNFVITLLILIVILSIIVFIHEFGHFLAAKRKGVYVSEFAIGMGPKIFSFRRRNDETLYSIRALPLGGFNSIAESKEGNPDLRDDQILENKSFFAKFFVLIMGIIFNFILAIILLFINGLIFGSPVNDPYVGNINSDTPAEKANLKEGDLILEINGVSISTWDDVLLETRFLKEKQDSFDFKVSRDNEEIDIVIEPEYVKDDNGKDIPQFGFDKSNKKDKGFVNAVKYAFVGTWDNTLSVFKILGKLFTGKIGADNLSGPIGVYSVIDQIKANGLETLIYLTAYLSINVAIINLLPVPVFDGGRILLLIIEKILRRKLNPKVEIILNNIGAILLIILMIYVAFNDIFKLV